MRYLVDSDWLIDATSGRLNALLTLDRLTDHGLGVSIIAVAEVYEGAFGTFDPEAILADIREFLSGFAILAVTEAVVERFACLRATLPREGQLIPDLYLLIAATGLDADLTLLTHYVRRFEWIEDLRLYQPS